MTPRWLAAAFHLLALGMGLGAVTVRANALQSDLDARELKRLFMADSLWGVAALMWISTGLWRLFSGLEKPSEYYFHNPLFWLKMSLLALILLLEIKPMIALIQWRIKLARSEVVDTSGAPVLATISTVQAVLVVLMVFVATAMARGLGHIH